MRGGLFAEKQLSYWLHQKVIIHSFSNVSRAKLVTYLSKTLVVIFLPERIFMLTRCNIYASLRDS